MTNEQCSNCEEPIAGAPVYFDGEAYCCAGCVAGGPCVCTYELPADKPVDALLAVGAPALTTRAHPPVAATRPLAPTPSIAPPEDRQPIPIRPDLEGRAIVLRIGGFEDQRNLLEFAGLLETEPALTEVALTRAEPNDAWFSLRASSAEQVCLVLEGLQGYRIRATAFQSSVEAQILPSESGEAPLAPGAPEKSGGDEAVLPPRARFRVFSRPGGVRSRWAPPAAATPEEALLRYSEHPAEPAAPGYAAYAAETPAEETEPFERQAVETETEWAAPAATPTEWIGPAAASAPAPLPVREAPASAPPALPQAPSAPPATARPETPETPMATPRSEMVAADDRPGGAVPVAEHLTLVVYPFHSFVALNEFQAAVRGLHGVSNTRVRRFYRGTLHLAVDYEDIIPLSERLVDLRGFRWQIVSESRQEIELVLEESGSLIAAEGDG